MNNIITEYDNALFINDYQVPFVLSESVKFDRNDMTVTLTVAVSEYRRISAKKEPVSKYEFKELKK